MPLLVHKTQLKLQSRSRATSIADSVYASTIMSGEGAEVLLKALADNQICSLLVTNLERLDETVKEESEGVHNTLAIIENLVELRPEMCKDVAEVFIY